MSRSNVNVPCMIWDYGCFVVWFGNGVWRMMLMIMMIIMLLTIMVAVIIVITLR